MKGDEPPRVGRIETSEAPDCGFRGSARLDVGVLRVRPPERGAESDQSGAAAEADDGRRARNLSRRPGLAGAAIRGRDIDGWPESLSRITRRRSQLRKWLGTCRVTPQQGQRADASAPNERRNRSRRQRARQDIRR